MATRSALLVALAIAGIAAGACSQLYDLSALGPGDADDGGPGADTSTLDAGPLVCPTGEGPPMILAGSFCIDSTEVTNAQYVRFLDNIALEAPAFPPACAFKKKSLTPGSSEAADRDLPVRNVDWCDAFLYCAWAKKRLCGRLGSGPALRASQAVDPTVSEWAFACTGGKTQDYPYGTQYDSGLCNSDSDAAAPASTRCAGGLPGLVDMVGNVAEWVDACESASDSRFDDCPVAGGSFQSRGAGAKCGASTPAARGGPRPDQGIRCCSP